MTTFTRAGLEVYELESVCVCGECMGDEGWGRGGGSCYMNQCLHAWLQNTLGENALQLGQLGACCHFSTLEVEAREPRFKVVLSKSEASLGSWRRVSNRGRDQGVGRHDTAW